MTVAELGSGETLDGGSQADREGDRLEPGQELSPTAEEWAEAAWKLQGWVRSGFDVAGVCIVCGTADPSEHVNGCPWPVMRRLLDRDWKRWVNS